jgi:hypothetical protein
MIGAATPVDAPPNEPGLLAMRLLDASGGGGPET